MRLSNSLFVQNNMANNTQNNKLAKNIPHFAGEQSQYATTPPGLTRAYAGVKPSFKGQLELEGLEALLKAKSRYPSKTSAYYINYTNIKKVIPDEFEALCVWAHSLRFGAQRNIARNHLSSSMMYRSTLDAAKNAIIKARSGASESDLAKVENNLVWPLRNALGLPHLAPYEERVFGARLMSPVEQSITDAQPMLPASSSQSLPSVKKSIAKTKQDGEYVFPSIKTTTPDAQPMLPSLNDSIAKVEKNKKYDFPPIKTTTPDSQPSSQNGHSVESNKRPRIS